MNAERRVELVRKAIDAPGDALPDWQIIQRVARRMADLSSDPAIGEKGREERVPEFRLETVFPEERHEQVVSALRRAHPYEEPAFDVYSLL